MLMDIVRSHRSLTYVLLLSSSISVWLSLLRVITTGSTFFVFLLWNLVLAWIPLLLGLWLAERLDMKKRIGLGTLLLGAAWLSFLPNSFYIVTDFIHLQIVDPQRILLDVILLTSFTWNGFVLGYLSLWLVHKKLQQRINVQLTHWLVGVVLLMCSFAIYLGRYLRWNTWDLLLSPAAILFDLSERFINPIHHLDTFTTTGLFFVLLGSIYVVVWHGVDSLKSTKRS